jgi:hypothetical protein
VQCTSLLAHTAQADQSAREFLGDDHPLVRVLRRTSAAMRHLLSVAVILVFAAVAWFDGAHAALAVMAAAAVVEVALALQLASLRWLAERACDLIIQGRADLPLDDVRRQRRRLLDRAHCDDLADWVDRTCTVAERSLRSPHQPATFFNARVILAARPELADISARLRKDAPGVRGVALLERLLSEGGSPLHGRSVSALRQELHRIRFTLGA